ncbi:hypothetical protein K1719_014962 [Acacia pycnantha]|nr:hypothetical protein K1719_014962 [Acacia pycnantha]
MISTRGRLWNRCCRSGTTLPNSRGIISPSMTCTVISSLPSSIPQSDLRSEKKATTRGGWLTVVEVDASGEGNGEKEDREESALESQCKHRHKHQPTYIADNFGSLDEVLSALREAGLESYSNLILALTSPKAMSGQASTRLTGKAFILLETLPIHMSKQSLSLAVLCLLLMKRISYCVLDLVMVSG